MTHRLHRVYLLSHTVVWLAIVAYVAYAFFYAYSHEAEPWYWILLVAASAVACTQSVRTLLLVRTAFK